MLNLSSGLVYASQAAGGWSGSLRMFALTRRSSEIHICLSTSLTRGSRSIYRSAGQIARSPVSPTRAAAEMAWRSDDAAARANSRRSHSLLAGFSPSGCHDYMGGYRRGLGVGVSARLIELWQFAVVLSPSASKLRISLNVRTRTRSRKSPDHGRCAR